MKRPLTEIAAEVRRLREHLKGNLRYPESRRDAVRSANDLMKQYEERLLAAAEWAEANGYAEGGGQ